MREGGREKEREGRREKERKETEGEKGEKRRVGGEDVAHARRKTKASRVSSKWKKEKKRGGGDDDRSLTLLAVMAPPCLLVHSRSHWMAVRSSLEKDVFPGEEPEAPAAPGRAKEPLPPPPPLEVDAMPTEEDKKIDPVKWLTAMWRAFIAPHMIRCSFGR